MFSSIDKAIVAFIMAIAYLAHNLLGVDLGITEGVAGSIAMFVTTVLVYFVPNGK